MYKVYGRLQSRASRVIWMLEELEQPYEFVNVPPHDPQVLALNPTGKIPVLVDADTIITDSSAIMTYLADKHGALSYPAGTLERAKQDALYHALLDELDAVLWTATRHQFILPEDQRVPEVIESLCWELNRNFERFGKRLEGPFLLGDKMTIADILCGHCLTWAKAFNFPMNSEALKTYGKELRQRPAYLRMGALAKS